MILNNILSTQNNFLTIQLVEANSSQIALITSPGVAVFWSKSTIHQGFAPKYVSSSSDLRTMLFGAMKKFEYAMVKQVTSLQQAQSLQHNIVHVLSSECVLSEDTYKELYNDAYSSCNICSPPRNPIGYTLY